MEYCIKASKLSAGYNGILVFTDFNIEIPKGKITTLIGSNGSGKSTILKTMSRLIAPTEGVVCLRGKSIHSMPTKLVAQNLALLPQGAQTPSGITVADLVEYGRFPYRSKMSGLSLEYKKIIKWALACINMKEFADREMDKLSGGQIQRGWIAMALAQKTNILFLDEPTTYLDISHQLETLYLLQQLNIEQGVTIVMVLQYKRDIILLSYPLIVLAANGDVDAINAVLKHYEGYIAALFTRQLYDESGNSHLCVDELLHRRCGTNELNDWNEYKNSLQIISRKQNPTFQNWKNS